jgi:hypothetical protein
MGNLISNGAMQMIVLGYRIILQHFKQLGNVALFPTSHF